MRVAWLVGIGALALTVREAQAQPTPAGPPPIAGPKSGEGLPRCDSKEDLQRLSGKNVVLIGTYVEIDSRMKATPPPQYTGLAAVQLKDGTQIMLEPSWSLPAQRPLEERQRLAGRKVELKGTLHRRTPAPHQLRSFLVNPCVSSVVDLRLAGPRR